MSPGRGHLMLNKLKLLLLSDLSWPGLDDLPLLSGGRLVSDLNYRCSRICWGGRYRIGERCLIVCSIRSGVRIVLEILRDRILYHRLQIFWEVMNP